MSEKVGIGQIKVLRNEGVLVAYGLGSCIGLFLYDQDSKVGGLAHIMLSGRASETTSLKTKYAENAVDEMLEEMQFQGGDRRRTVAVIVGGAHMFHDTTLEDRETIGGKNIAAVRITLKLRGIPVVAEDVGKDYGRTVEAHIRSGHVSVKSFRHAVKEISSAVK